MILRSFSHRTQSGENKFRACTTLEGRIDHWVFTGKEADYTLERFLEAIVGSGESSWQMCFDAATYFGRENTYWSVVDINVNIKTTECHHVSLFLGSDDYRAHLTLGDGSGTPAPTASRPRGVLSSDQARTKSKSGRSISPDQRKALMQHYTAECYPGREGYDQIADELGLTRRKVQRWFWATRYRLRHLQTNNRIGAHFSPDQRNELVRNYTTTRYLTRDGYDGIADKLGLTRAQVQRWFCAMRYRTRHQRNGQALPNEYTQPEEFGRAHETQVDAYGTIESPPLVAKAVSTSLDLRVPHATRSIPSGITIRYLPNDGTNAAKTALYSQKLDAEMDPQDSSYFADEGSADNLRERTNERFKNNVEEPVEKVERRTRRGRRHGG